MRSTARQAEVAARLRRYIAQHDEDRRTRCALIRALDAYSYRLKVENMVAGALVGRLRRDAAQYDADAERIRRLALTTKFDTLEAA
jgi:hypothetical protein